jgi:hypothetical protein
VARQGNRFGADSSLDERGKVAAAAVAAAAEGNTTEEPGERVVEDGVTSRTRMTKREKAGEKREEGTDTTTEGKERSGDEIAMIDARAVEGRRAVRHRTPSCSLEVGRPVDPRLSSYVERAGGC